MVLYTKTVDRCLVTAMNAKRAPCYLLAFIYFLTECRRKYCTVLGNLAPLRMNSPLFPDMHLKCMPRRKIPPMAAGSERFNFLVLSLSRYFCFVAPSIHLLCRTTRSIISNFTKCNGNRSINFYHLIQRMVDNVKEPKRMFCTKRISRVAYQERLPVTNLMGLTFILSTIFAWKINFESKMKTSTFMYAWTQKEGERYMHVPKEK